MNHFTVFAAKELHLINQVVYFKRLLESCQKKTLPLKFYICTRRNSCEVSYFICYLHIVFVLLKTMDTLTQLSENHQSENFYEFLLPT